MFSRGTVTGFLPSQSLLHRGRYLVLEVVGKGGMGAVYKAADLQLRHRIVAIKEMSQSGLAGRNLQDAIATFTREAEMLVYLKHQSLPHIYEQFEDNGRRYLVMEFIEGETLEARLESLRGQGVLSVQQVIDIGCQLCTVLDYLHTQQPPVIFRDLKPSNIMLDPQGQVYLIDFGIARIFKPNQVKDTIALGSSGYASPEQYRGSTSPRSDIYSLGATLHQMLTDDDPSATPFFFRSFSVQVPRLERLVLNMVTLDEYQRPTSMRKVQTVLEEIAHGRPPTRAKQQAHKSSPPSVAPSSSAHNKAPHIAGSSITSSPLTISIVLSAHPDDQRLWSSLYCQLLSLIDGFPAIQIKVDVNGQAQTVDDADLILLLLSNEFLSSPDCMAAANRAMDRHSVREAELLSVVLHPCALKGSRLAQIRTVPDEAIAHLSLYAQEQKILEVARLVRTLLVTHILAGKNGGPMNLLQWLLWQLYGNGFERCRYFLTGNYAVKHVHPSGLAGILLHLFDLQKKQAVAEYLIGPLRCKDLVYLLQRIDPTVDEPEAVRGTASRRKPRF